MSDKLEDIKALWSAIKKRIAGSEYERGSEEYTTEQSDAARQGAEVLNEALPESLSGRRAVMASRKKMELMDNMLNERGAR